LIRFNVNTSQSLLLLGVASDNQRTLYHLQCGCPGISCAFSSRQRDHQRVVPRLVLARIFTSRRPGHLGSLPTTVRGNAATVRARAARPDAGCWRRVPRRHSDTAAAVASRSGAVRHCSAAASDSRLDDTHGFQGRYTRASYQGGFRGAGPSVWHQSFPRDTHRTLLFVAPLLISHSRKPKYSYSISIYAPPVLYGSPCLQILLMRANGSRF